MVVAGIDLSTKKIAIAIVDGDRLSWIEIEAREGSAEERREVLFRKLRDVFGIAWLRAVERFHIEDISFLRSQRSELDLARIQGGVEMLLAELGIPYETHNNMSVKAMFKLTRKGKEAVKAYVEERFGVRVPSYDVADAALTALYGLEKER